MANEYRASGISIEVLASHTTPVRASGVAVEVLAAHTTPVRASGVYLEVLRTVATASTSRRRQVMAGSF